MDIGKVSTPVAALAPLEKDDAKWSTEIVAALFSNNPPWGENQFNGTREAWIAKVLRNCREDERERCQTTEKTYGLLVIYKRIKVPWNSHYIVEKVIPTNINSEQFKMLEKLADRKDRRILYYSNAFEFDDVMKTINDL